MRYSYPRGHLNASMSTLTWWHVSRILRDGKYGDFHASAYLSHPCKRKQLIYYPLLYNAQLLPATLVKP